MLQTSCKVSIPYILGEIMLHEIFLSFELLYCMWMHRKLWQVLTKEMNLLYCTEAIPSAFVLKTSADKSNINRIGQ